MWTEILNNDRIGRYTPKPAWLYQLPTMESSQYIPLVTFQYFFNLNCEITAKGFNKCVSLCYKKTPIGN